MERERNRVASISYTYVHTYVQQLKKQPVESKNTSQCVLSRRDGKGWGNKAIGACFEGRERRSDQICRVPGVKYS